MGQPAILRPWCLSQPSLGFSLAKGLFITCSNYSERGTLKNGKSLFSIHSSLWFANLYINFLISLQLFFSYFKDLVGKEVTVELKNDLAIRGTLHSVDQYLNIKLENTRVVDQEKFPHMVRFLILLYLCFFSVLGQNWHWSQ